MFALEQMETWVLGVSLAIPVVCLAALVLWQLLAYLAGKPLTRRRAVRESPEPPAPARPEDPERLERACAALEESLAGKYLELADSLLRKGQPQQAASALRRLVRSCPGTQQAQLARDRLHQLGAAENDT